MPNMFAPSTAVIPNRDALIISRLNIVSNQILDLTRRIIKLESLAETQINKLNAIHEALEVLIGSQGGLKIQKTPTSGDDYVYTAEYQNIVPKIINNI